jgi:hypothetical protein
MIDVALDFLARQYNAYRSARFSGTVGPGTFGEAVLSRPIDDTGKWVIPENQIGVALVNVEEERVLKTQLPEPTFINGRQVTLEPEIKLNLDVLFAAHFKDYRAALIALSSVITFFQAHPRFASDDHPDLDPAITRLVPELRSLGYEQLNQLWAFVGGKQLPSVVYRVRLVVLQDIEPRLAGRPLTTVRAVLTGR